MASPTMPAIAENPAIASFSLILARVMWSPEKAATWSKRVYASLIDPVASLAIQKRASSSAFMPTSSLALLRHSMMRSWLMSLKRNCWQRDLIVSGTFCSSVVAKMNMMYSGGSSMVLSSALNADVDSMCTSSMI